MKSGHSVRTRPMPGMHSLRGLMAGLGMGTTAPPPPPPQNTGTYAAYGGYAQKAVTALALTPAQQHAVASGTPVAAAAPVAAAKPVVGVVKAPAAASSNQTLLIAGGAVGLAALAAVAYKLHQG